MKYLNPEYTHNEILDKLWGIDIAKFPAHLSTIQLASRDLSKTENYPNIIYGDFFDIQPRSKVNIGIQHTLKAWGVDYPEQQIETQDLQGRGIEKTLPLMTAIIGNPPYTRQEELEQKLFGDKYKNKLKTVLSNDYKSEKISLRTSFYAYFIYHGLKFLNSERGRLGFVTLRSWLDVKYGEELQDFLLRHTKIVALVESSGEKWFEDAQMLPCIMILENNPKERVPQNHWVKFVQLKKPLERLVPTIKEIRDFVEECRRWEKIDQIVLKIEDIHENEQTIFLSYLSKKIGIFEDEEMRILMIKQEDLKNEKKWGKFLIAPTVYFRILDKIEDKLVKLDPDIADVKRGITTGANEYFCLPNKNHSIVRRDGYHLFDKETKKERFLIEDEFLQPVVNKIKPHRRINIKSDKKILMVSGELSLKGKNVSKYIKWGESAEHGREMKKISERKTCRNRRFWYEIKREKKAPLLSPSIFWGRHIIFHNGGKSYSTDCFDEIYPKKANSKTLCMILNSTFAALMMEFTGRYMENRDKTISNQIKVYELRELPVIDVRRLEKKTEDKLLAIFDRIADREIDILPEEIKNKDRKELDRVVFHDILGLSKQEAQELVEQTAKLFSNRIRRLQ